MPAHLSESENELLVLLQDAFPLTATPFASLGERLGWSEGQVMARLEELKASGTLRQIGAIFDTRRLGYTSTLVAAQVQPERLEEVATVISRHPGVSHNYSRDHELNLWFTLAAPPHRELAEEQQALVDQPGVLQALSLPTVRTYKIRARFAPGGADPAPVSPAPHARSARPLADDEIPYVRVLQEDLPLVERPFRVLAQACDLDEASTLDAAHRLLEAGIMRRYCGTLRHRQAGYVCNAMVCWQVAEVGLDEAGQAAANHPAVSHCYRRVPRPPLWPYQLFTMAHARSSAELSQAIGELHGQIRPERHVALYSLREFKKARLRYFDPAY